jgi:hypothetical protein
MPATNEKAQTRLLHEIAAEIRKDWKTMYFGAVPYVDAMCTLHSMQQSYGMDPAEDIVRRFLANASHWRGEVARRIKAELNSMLRKS